MANAMLMPPNDPDRQRRLAEALRANLRRRKGQVRTQPKPEKARRKGARIGLTGLFLPAGTASRLTLFVRSNKWRFMATQPRPDLAVRLIEAAIEQFGQHGFDGASTRDIAAASGTAMSSITYHFGGKDGLYLACADYIAEQIGAVHAVGMAAISAIRRAIPRPPGPRCSRFSRISRG